MLLQLGQQIVGANTIVFVLRRPTAVRSKSTDAESTLAVFRIHGIPDEAGAIIVARNPKILTLKAEKTLEPKLRFLRSTGLTGPELAQVLLINRDLILRGVDTTIVPYVEFLKSIIPSKDDLFRVLKTRGIIRASNIQTLVDRGVPDHVIRKIILRNGTALCRTPHAFLAALDRLEEVGLRRTNSNFRRGLLILCLMSRSTILMKVRLFRELGFASDKDVYLMFCRYPDCVGLSVELIRKKWALYKELMFMSDEQVAMILRKYPRCLGLSDETFRSKAELFFKLGWTVEGLRAVFLKMPQIVCLSTDMINRKVEFLRETVGWTTEVLCTNPSLLGYSLQERMIPRCAVINVLVSEGFLRAETAMKISRFLMSEQNFLATFVDFYKEVAPLVIDAYRGKIEFRGWDYLKQKNKNQQQLLKALE